MSITRGEQFIVVVFVVVAALLMLSLSLLIDFHDDSDSVCGCLNSLCFGFYLAEGKSHLPIKLLITKKTIFSSLSSRQSKIACEHREYFTVALFLKKKN